MKFCPYCRMYLYLKTDSDKALIYRCYTCGYEDRSAKGGLILETNFDETTEGDQILVNEFTRFDPTLPHVDTIECPNQSCPTRTEGAKKDVIYLKYDKVNMKYVYICNVCEREWKS